MFDLVSFSLSFSFHLSLQDWSNFGNLLLYFSIVFSFTNLLPLALCPSLATFSIAFSLQVHLYSFCVLAVATPLFWSSKNKDSFLFEEPKWNRLDSSALSTVLLYAALFYLLPSAEFYLELAYFPDLKSSSLWTFGVSVSAAAGGDSGGQLYFEVILATGCFVFCTMLTLFSAAYFLRASLVLNARQLSTVLAMLELVMHVSSQVQY